MRTYRSGRGVTLVELLVAMTITALVMVGAITVVRSQQKAYYDGQRLRGAQGSARRALLAVENALPRAGFGMDASLALDLAGWYAGPCPAATMGTCPVDSVENSDELVFYSRDPAYWLSETSGADPVGNAWRISAVTEDDVSIYARAGDSFRLGQIFLAVCPNSTYAYFTSGQNTTFDTTGIHTITLSEVATADPFKRQDVAAALTCFTTTPATNPAEPWPTAPARLFLVHRYRFHVRPIATGTFGTATRYDPFLVLDQGVDVNVDGAVDEADEVLLAEGIETIQVTYLLYDGDLAPVGATPGTEIAFTPGSAAAATIAADTLTTTLFGTTPPSGQTAYGPSSFYGYTYGPPPAAARESNHQANVQAIRVAVLARSTATDYQANTRADSFLPLANQNALPDWIASYAAALNGRDGYQRVVLETTVNLPNMATRAMTYF